MRLILARHGNTFAAGDKAVWVGRNQDLPLVAKGEEQARHLAQALVRASIAPAAIYCGPLLRTRRTAEILVEELSLKPPLVTDERLSEIDYGHWGGLSNDEIVERFGDAEFLAWQNESHWPKSGGWRPAAHEVATAVSDLTKEILRLYAPYDDIVLISSNGVLRYFLKLIPGAFDERRKGGDVKVSTGHICELEQVDRHLRLISWNLDPGVAFG